MGYRVNRYQSTNEPGLMGSRREICPATPSSKPCLAKTRKATARCCILYLRSSSLSANVGGERIFTLPSLSPRKCTSSKNSVDMGSGCAVVVVSGRTRRVACCSDTVDVAVGGAMAMECMNMFGCS